MVWVFLTSGANRDQSQSRTTLGTLSVPAVRPNTFNGESVEWAHPSGTLSAAAPSRLRFAPFA